MKLNAVKSEEKVICPKKELKVKVNKNKIFLISFMTSIISTNLSMANEVSNQITGGMTYANEFKKSSFEILVEDTLSIISIVGMVLTLVSTGVFVSYCITSKIRKTKVKNKLLFIILILIGACMTPIGFLFSVG